MRSKSFIEEELEREKSKNCDPEIHESPFDWLESLFPFGRKPIKILKAYEHAVNREEYVMGLIDVYTSVMERNIEQYTKELSGESAAKYIAQMKWRQRHGL